jgi:hypothetical protein
MHVFFRSADVSSALMIEEADEDVGAPIKHGKGAHASSEMKSPV